MDAARAKPITIGRLSRATGVKLQTIRYYEAIGLLPQPPRSAGNQRRYGRMHVDRLMFIRHSRELGFQVDAIRELLELADHPERPCASADRIARQHLAQVERRMAALAALRAELQRIAARCRGGRAADCRVIDALGDHGQCLQTRHLGPDQANSRL